MLGNGRVLESLGGETGIVNSCAHPTPILGGSSQDGYMISVITPMYKPLMAM